MRIAVLDTGYTEGHQWLDACVQPDGMVVEELDAMIADGVLDDEAGHGTFIAGIINRLAPAAQITACQVLLSDGWGDEVTIASAIANHAAADVINLSLGAYTQGNLPPIGLMNALRQVPPHVGRRRRGRQRGHRRPVLAGGAEAGDRRRRSRQRGHHGRAYSNFGHWVDCAAPADDVISTFPT